MPLRFRTALAAAVSGRLLRRTHSTTAPSRPQWAMIERAHLVKSTALDASFHLAEPPCASRLLVPAHLVDPRPRPGPHSDILGMAGVHVRAVSPDGFLLLNCLDVRMTAPVDETRGTAQLRKLEAIEQEPLVTRFVCNPLSGQLYRLPDIGGTKKSASCHYVGLLTRNRSGRGPPDRYAAAELREEEEPSRRFVMRRFLSETGEWELLPGLPSPLPLARRMVVDHEAVAFDGRLWWVDVNWGVVSVDPFSDRPELRFVELPEGMPGEEYMAPGIRMLARYRRVGVSEGRLRYAEVSQTEPFLLRSFALDGNDGGGRWTVEHEVALSPLWADGGYPWLPMEDGQAGAPRIGVIDPTNAGVMHLTIGNYAVAVDMDRGKLLASAVVFQDRSPGHLTFTFLGCFQPFLLPPWLGSSRIPSAGL